MTFHDILAALPDDALVPVSWVRSQVRTHPDSEDRERHRDLSAREFAELVNRSAAQVRAWCAAGSVPGAYRLPGEKRHGAWRIPHESVDAFRQRGTTRVPKEIQEGGTEAPDVGAWRRAPRSVDAPRTARRIVRPQASLN